MFLLTLQSLHFSDMIAAAFLHIIQCIFALPAPGFNYYHESNTSSPKRWMMSDLILNGRLSHIPKTLYSIFVTVLGILMLVSELQRIKAQRSIVFKIFDIFTLVSE